MSEYRSYLITLRPLEPFLFGGEHNFDYGTKRQTPQRYYISSEITPSATTLFGTLRYAVLAANGALVTKYGDATQIEKAAKLVGSKSFNLAEKDQRFGVIDSISPLFLVHYTEEACHRLIPLPSNHAFGKENMLFYSPCEIKTADGLQCNHCTEQLYAKNRDIKFVQNAWMSLHDRSIFKQGDIFAEHLQVGINAHRLDSHEELDESFFKKSKLILKTAQDRFAFYASMKLTREAADTLSRGILVAMGQNQVPFLLEATLEENRLEEDIKKALTFCDCHPFYYALSDAYLEEVPNGFFLAQTKPFRYITTNLSKSEHIERFARSAKQYRLFCAGSVFYETLPEASEHCKTIGLNHFIEIGGSNK